LLPAPAGRFPSSSDVQRGREEEKEEQKEEEEEADRHAVMI
jgi:hypothetical protein